MPNPDWIAIDWGTSNLRGWSMSGSAMLNSAQSDEGMSSLDPDGFEPALHRLITQLGGRTDLPVIACGMVGSRQGWVEAPYRTVPCAPLDAPFASVGSAHIIAGLNQTAPADVMRGEETQIAGFLALNSGWDGVICLPGTHTKWAEISAGEVVSFQTFMSGEMFALLSDHSVLRHSVAHSGINADWDGPAFETAVNDILSRPERLAAQLFAIRADDLLNATPARSACARLSGLLIGAELAAARPYWLGREIAIIGANAQANHYGAALKTQGVPATIADAERMTLAGLTAAYRLWKDTK